MFRRVRIKLEGGNNQTLHPGAQIRGTVEYKSPADDRITSLAITFRAVEKTYSKKNSSQQTECVELFHISEVLQDKLLWTEPRRVYSWNFTFGVPMMTGPDRCREYGDGVGDGGGAFFDGRPHSLPPSIGNEQSGYVRVVYNMYVICTRAWRNGVAERGKGESLVHNLGDMRFLPDEKEVPEIEDPLEESRRVRPLEQSFKVATNSKRRMSLFSRNGQDPQVRRQRQMVQSTYSFTLSVMDFPSVIVSGKPISLSMRLRRDLLRSNADAEYKASCLYKSCTVSLISNTHRRFASTPNSPALTESETKRIAVDRSPEPLEFNGRLLRKSFETGDLADWPPTFKGYSVGRTYDIRIEISIVCDGQEFEAKFERGIKLVHVVSSEIEQVRRENNIPPPVFEFQREYLRELQMERGAIVEELPTYDEVRAGRCDDRV